MGVADFNYHGERWRRITHAPKRRFCVGLDLGQASDPTAIAIVEHHRTPLDEFAVDRDRKVITQRVEEFLDVRHLERLRLNTSYTDIAGYVFELMRRSPLRECGAELVVDQTGVGRPVIDLPRRAGLRLVAATITSGDSETRVNNEWRVPKHLLVTGLDAKLSVKEPRFSDRLREAEVMKSELKDFRRHIGSSGYMTYNARSGAHDVKLLILLVQLGGFEPPTS
jgi:hypothetical protein